MAPSACVGDTRLVVNSVPASVAVTATSAPPTASIIGACDACACAATGAGDDATTASSALAEATHRDASPANPRNVRNFDNAAPSAAGRATGQRTGAGWSAGQVTIVRVRGRPAQGRWRQRSLCAREQDGSPLDRWIDCRDLVLAEPEDIAYIGKAASSTPRMILVAAVATSVRPRSVPMKSCTCCEHIQTPAPCFRA